MMSTFIVFAEDWQRHPSSSQHVMRQLSAHHHVIWVNSIGLRSPGFNGRDWRRLWHKLVALSGHQPAIEREADPCAPAAVIAPLCLPLHQFAVVRWLNRSLLRWQIRRTLADLQLQNDTLRLWLALPSAECMIGALAEHQVIYYCGDDFSALQGVDHDTMTLLEQRLVARADLVLCASAALVEKFNRPQCHLLNHGVDLPLFSQQWPRPELLQSQKPVAGFYGLLADWIDVELLCTVAQQCPHWHFVLIGQQRTDISALATLNNVQLIEAVPHHWLIHYACHFQALLMPFRQCKQIDYCNPLKLREYLAIGKPVISVPFPALRPYQDFVMASTEAADWVAWLNQIALWDEAAQRDCQVRNRSAVMYESWGHKAQQIEALLATTSSPQLQPEIVGRLL